MFIMILFFYLLLELFKNLIRKKFEELEIQTLLSGKYDSNNAIVTMHPGAGGTESPLSSIRKGYPV